MKLKSNRLEAFSDGVLAIIITIMVLEFEVPRTTELRSLVPILPVFLSYFLSFMMVAIYWNNHHHLFSAVESINGKVMWANMGLLFWLSLLPFATAWMGENKFTKWPVFVYGVVLMGCGLAYYVMTLMLIKIHKNDSALVMAVTKNKKEQVTIFIYIVGLAACFINAYISLLIYFGIAIFWIIPDKRIEEKMMAEAEDGNL